MIRHVSFIAAIVLLVLLAAPLATLAQQDIRGDDDCLVITPRNRHECCERTASIIYDAVFQDCVDRHLPPVGDVCHDHAYDASRQGYADCYYGDQVLLGIPAHFRLYATGSATSSVRFRSRQEEPARLAVYRGQVREGTLVLNGVPVADLAADFPDGAARTVVPVVLDAGWNTLELLGTGTNSGSILVIPLDQE